MSNRLRIKFLGTQRPNEKTIIDAITDISPVSIRDIFLAQGHAIVIFNNSDDIDKITNKEANEKLAAYQLRALSNSIHNSEKTIFVTKVRPFVADYSTDDIINNINNNNNVSVKSLFIVRRRDYSQGQPISLKMTLSTAQDTQSILDSGITIMKMDIPPERIFMEEPITITQCFKCFKYGHETNQCPGDISYCSKCAGKHNFRTCTSTYSKCINCNEPHLAVSRECKARKDHIRKLLEDKKEQRAATKSNLAQPSPPSSSSSSPPSPHPPNNTYTYSNTAFPTLKPKQPPPAHTTPQTVHINNINTNPTSNLQAHG